MAWRAPNGIQEVSGGVKRAKGPFATVYFCPQCNFMVKVPKGTGWAGKGSPGAAAAQVRAHVRAAHPEKVVS